MVMLACRAASARAREGAMSQDRDDESTARRDAWRVFIIANVTIFLACLVMVWATGMLGGDIEWQGWIFIAAALVAVSVLGSGLMTLLFYSSRRQDAPPVYEVAEDSEPTTTARPERR
jgi:hypothetical protein